MISCMLCQVVLVQRHKIFGEISVNVWRVAETPFYPED